MIPNASSQAPLLVLDFDGTVALGDGPVLAYAQAVADQLPEQAAKALLAEVDQFLAGESQRVFKDGYDAVARLSETTLSPEQRSTAYLESRQAIARGEVTVHAPEGLIDFLREVSGYAERLLFTNAPLAGVTESLIGLGLNGLIDHVVPNARKPLGFAQQLPDLLDGRPAAHLLSVGDVWANDIEIPLNAGCSTAFIDRFDLHTGPAHLRAETIEELYPGIQEWAQDPVAFQLHHSLPHSPPDR
ncbi:HAD family hydrolase [Psychromicrobium sp. YIM B11713]|uniref:HAD family hydrolase n=1 Tax=Psychromicrobium sp. YIM B11713 TaxID=3145233 RepID=UPI00374E6315